MELKYAADLRRHQNCPPNGAGPSSREVFRFVHAQLEDRRNYLPPAKLDPSRQFPPHKRCDALALSLFCTQEQAIQFYLALRKGMPNIHKTIGTHLAVCLLTEADGMATRERRDGHLSLFESRDAAWDNRFKIVRAL